MDSRQIDELTALLAVAHEGSFVKAGRRLHRHATIISKRIASLEARLGVRLVERTTRQIRLTDAGRRLADKTESAVDSLHNAELEASDGAENLRGKLRLAFPATMGRLWLAPILPEFLKMYPALKVEVFYSEQYVDLVGEGFDAAIRIGVLQDSRLKARKLWHQRRVLGASPEYVAKHGLPGEPEDLIHHNCLGFPALATFPEWQLSNGDRVESIITRSSLLSNDSIALLEAARQGIGILGAGDWLMAKDFAQGSLVPVLPSWSFDASGGIYLVRPSSNFAPARTEAFIEWMVGRFQNGPPWIPS